MSKKIKEYPGHSFFVFQAPMYSKFTITPEQEDELITKGTRIEGLCVKCGVNRVFQNGGNNRAKMLQNMASETRMAFDDTIRFHCTFDNAHQVRLFAVLQEGVIEKCGQKPSYAELAQVEDRELTKNLSEQDRREYYKAVGLAAHDTGIGAYTYLRRIFENLVFSRFDQNKAANKWKDEDFYKLRMTERISFLKDYLPPLLVKNSATYSIVSDGIHNLTEEECLNFFPTLRSGMLLILQEADELKERQKREAEFVSSVAAYSSSKSKT
jgi:hypothetical protein